MILSLKVLAAAGLAASVATGGALANRPPDGNHLVAATAGPVQLQKVDDDQGEDETTESTVTTTSNTFSVPSTPSAPSVTVQPAGEAGTVTLSISGGVVTITDIAANGGWVPEIEERAGREVEVSFRNGLRRIDFTAELEDGRLETRVRERTVEGGDTPVATTPTTPTTFDDRDDDDDRITTSTTLDDRIGRDDDDNSGPGGGGDDRSGPGDGGDDHSGSSGSGDDDSGHH